MIHVKSKILSNEKLTDECWRISLDSDRIAAEALPGQFINVRINQNNAPLLRRPFSISRTVELDSGRLGIEIVYRVVGRGTRLMTALQQGDELDIIGPLGHGYDLREDTRAHLLVAGGVGAAGLLMLGEEISKRVRDDDLELYILLGADTERSLVLEKEFQGLEGKLMVATDDGSRGFKGVVTELLEDLISGEEVPRDCAIYSCGPESMFSALKPVCQRYDIPCQVSVEKNMMCGMGACFNCICRVDRTGVLKHRDLSASHIQFIPEEDVGYGLVCKDGPVFDLEEVVLDD